MEASSHRCDLAEEEETTMRSAISSTTESLTRRAAKRLNCAREAKQARQREDV